MPKHDTLQDEPFSGSILDRDNSRVAAEVVTPNLVEFERLERTSAGLKLFGRVAVEGVPGSVDRILFNAMLASGIPRFGELHRILGIPVNRLNVRMAPDNTKDAFVDIEWGVDTADEDLFDQDPDDPNAPPRLEVTSTLVPARTELEFAPDGTLTKPIVVTFRPPPTTENPDPEEQKQSVTVDYMAPVSVVRFYRRERDDPLLKARRFMGRVNSNDDVFGDPARRWLITRLGGPTNDRGETYNVTYEFQRSVEATWDAVARFEDSQGRRHKDATVGNGIRTGVKVQPEIDFNLLELTF